MILRYLPLLFILGFANLGFAADSAEASDPMMDLLYKAVNFLIVLVLLHLFAKKPITNMLKASAKATKEAAESGKRKVEEAEKTLAAMKTKITELENELSQKREMAIKSISKEKEDLIKDAEISAEKILAQAQQRIEQEIIQAKEKIRNYLVEESMKGAESMISKKIGVKEQEALLSDYSELLKKSS